VKLTESKLRQIIKEEIKKLVKEQKTKRTVQGVCTVPGNCRVVELLKDDSHRSGWTVGRISKYCLPTEEVEAKVKKFNKMMDDRGDFTKRYSMASCEI